MAAEMKYGEYISGGVEIFKANLVPCIVATLCLCIPIVGMVVMVNFFAGIKGFKEGGTPIDIGGLFNFENVVDKILVVIVMAIGFMLCVIPGCLIYFAPLIVADKPGTPFMDAVNQSLAFGKANLVNMIILVLILGFLGSIGSVALGIGMLITYPISMCAAWCAYADHKGAISA